MTGIVSCVGTGQNCANSIGFLAGNDAVLAQHRFQNVLVLGQIKGLHHYGEDFVLGRWWHLNLILEIRVPLLDAVERGIIPNTIAAEISKANDEDVQRALTEAYENGTLPGDQILAIRRIVDDRNLIGKGIKSIRTGKPRTAAPTSPALVRAHQKEVDRQRQLLKKAGLAQGRLAFITSAMGRLLAEDHFVALLRAEGMTTLPQPVAERLGLAEA